MKDKHLIDEDLVSVVDDDVMLIMKCIDMCIVCDA